MGVSLTKVDPDLLSNWERARLLSRGRYERLVTTTWGLTAGALASLTGLAMHPATATVALAAVVAGAAGVAWAGVARANHGPRRALREAYERWLMTATMTEATREVVRAYVVAARNLAPWAPDEALAKYRSMLTEAAKSEGVAPDDPIFQPIEKALEAMAAQANAALRKTQEEIATRAVAARAALESARYKEDEARALNGLAEQRLAGARDCADLGMTALVYPAGTPTPSSSIGVEVAALRHEVDEAERRAADGRVYESHAAGVILNDQARWSAYAMPFRLSQELVELFEPAHAVEPSPQRK